MGYSEAPAGTFQAPFEPPVRLDRDVRVAGIALRFSDWPGLRGPVVCVGAEPSFRPLAVELARAGWRVVTLDQPADRFGYLDLLNGLATLVETCGFQPCVLLGQGVGAVVALLFAGWRPASVERLVLLDDPARLVASAARATASDPVPESLRLAPPAVEALWPRVVCPLLGLDRADPARLAAEVRAFLADSAL